MCHSTYVYIFDLIPQFVIIYLAFLVYSFTGTSLFTV